MCDSSHWFNDLSHAGIAADASGAICLLQHVNAGVSSGEYRLDTRCRECSKCWALFNGVNHWDAFTLDVRADAVVTKLFDMEWVTVQQR